MCLLPEFKTFNTHILKKMTNNVNINNEQLSADAFSRQSIIFDAIYASNTIVTYKREQVRNHVIMLLQPNSKILELNAGTGEDAIYFARHGHRVHATDIADGMLNTLNDKVRKNDLADNITNEKCSYTELKKLGNKGPYDMIFSNFAGLNCTENLGSVLQSLKPLLKDKGLVSLVILPKFCLWETLLVFKGKFKTAFRRFNSKNGADAHIEGVHFKCWYYNPSFIIKALKDDYDLLDLEGLCVFVPPSYIENFAEKHPALYQFLKNFENKMKSKWPWRGIGDYYIITLRRK
jgi:ubiquinone/menaquinone biosynthesis C-methylase UbiE